MRMATASFDGESPDWRISGLPIVVYVGFWHQRLSICQDIGVEGAGKARVEHRHR
jgi:hypothetical protein